MLFALFMASGASAAQITALPQLGNGVFVAANADSDACSTVFDQLAGCASSFGGVDAIATANPDDLMQCACCASSRKVADAYGDCSSYIVDEMPAMSTDADLYGQLGGFCEGLATCGPTGSNDDDDEPSSTSAEGAPSTTEGPDDDDIPSSTSDIDIITSSFAEFDAGCSNLADMIDSCSMATPGFTDLGYASQAKCYCCGGRSSTWTDEFDQYASTCANWAVTAEPDTIYVVASRYATFCENFDDACEPATTTTEDSSDSEPTESPSETETNTDAEETGDSDSSNGNGNGSGNGGDDDDSLGSGLKVQVGAIMAAVLFGGMAIVL